MRNVEMLPVAFLTNIPITAPFFSPLAFTVTFVTPPTLQDSYGRLCLAKPTLRAPQLPPPRELTHTLGEDEQTRRTARPL